MQSSIAIHIEALLFKNMLIPKKKAFKYCKYIFYFVLSQAILLYLFAHLSFFSSLLHKNSHEESENLRVQVDRLTLDVKASSEKLNALKREQQESSEELVALKLEQFKNHPILGLNDEELDNTTISAMMEWYEILGTDATMRTCSEDFGNVLVQRWRNEKKSYCSSKTVENANDDSVLASSIDCHLVKQTRHHGNGDQLCLMKNVAVNMGVFGDDSVTRPVVEHYVATRHNDQPYIKFPKGTVKANCNIHPDLWDKKFMPGWNADWTTNAVKIIEKIVNENETEIRNTENQNQLNTDETIYCDEYVDHPVLINQRDTFANFFHDSEDFFNVYLALAILQWKSSETQIYLTGEYTYIFMCIYI